MYGLGNTQNGGLDCPKCIHLHLLMLNNICHLRKMSYATSFNNLKSGPGDLEMSKLKGTSFSLIEILSDAESREVTPLMGLSRYVQFCPQGSFPISR